MERINEILQIPDRCLLERKIHKTFFKKNFELTLSERNLLDDFSIVVGIDWIASISPASANISRYADERYIYEEVQIIAVQTNENGFERNVPKIADLVQKYIPYPIVLCIYYDTVAVFQTCNKRINQNDLTRRTIEEQYFSVPINLTATTTEQTAFLNSIAYARLDKTNLKTYYEAYIQCIVALQTTAYTGHFVPRNKEQTAANLQTLQTLQNLQNEIVTLHNTAKKETQLSARVALNLQIQQLRTQIEQLKTLLTA
jgi:hypothetical protein